MAYNSKYKGSQIDAAVGAVLDKEAAWDAKAGGTHASQHATGGSDPVTPAMIGAVQCANYLEDMNDLVEDGHYRLGSNANLPVKAHYGQASVFRSHSNSDTCAQIVFGYTGAKYAAFRGGQMVDGVWNWEDWQTIATTDYAVNKAGDTMTAPLTISWDGVGSAKYYGASDGASVETYSNDYNKKRQLILYNNEALSDEANALRLYNAQRHTLFSILHTGNKPSGSYTGNGDATSRTIDTGGIGCAVLVWSVNAVALITPGGAICQYSNTLSALPTASVKFDAGVLTIVSTDSKINANGVTYYYQVL